ncbi:esterase [Nostoc linckia z18]|uniref:Esterase n=2 Tax=Nostoc linckia TaxID=92942 RepID=A0A9Q5Z9R7_NOSLI|nr:alpha/beta fold hydrolase [Nostoc linckia]PHK40308.1 esterase [Nostoc linckia z15]PHK44214.1 esterase [Nostoc linckia z16]PHJ58154.1 esterase [Nostoc linckia z1]PHJ59187.1 esterase [Nostoc linckia z3]PHJ63452.1 esterase [Nostoc linckia z2]
MMCYTPSYNPSWFLQNGFLMTVYTALWGKRYWETTIEHPEPSYHEQIFIGSEGVPIFGLVAIPENARGTIIGTYGITGELETQWYLRLLGRKAFALGYAVVLFDWRAHGKTAQLSPTLTSDGLYEGEDYVRIAAAAKAMGCPGKFWFAGFSLGGQLALWGVKVAGEVIREYGDLELEDSDIGGGMVICPSLDSQRSLSYLVTKPFGRYIEAGIAKDLKKLAWRLHEIHPGSFDPKAIERANSIWGFDNELVIHRLGFPSVEAYYQASSALKILPQISKPTLIIYAADDPLFDPAIIPELQAACDDNPAIDLLLTQYGGHVGYVSSKQCQQQLKDPDIWWAWNRILEWLEQRID